jgi:hypothetical protein
MDERVARGNFGMLSLSDLSRICAVTLSGGFGATVIRHDYFNTIDYRRLRFGVANARRDVCMNVALRGSEQGIE